MLHFMCLFLKIHGRQLEGIFEISLFPISYYYHGIVPFPASSTFISGKLLQDTCDVDDEKRQEMK